MKNRKLLVAGLLTIVAAFTLFGLGNASDGNPFSLINMKLNEIIRLLQEEVIPQLGCEPIIGVPKTGQTTSYATGDDGYWQAGTPWSQPRFTDNLDGTATDNLTGLLWLLNANCDGIKTWDDAIVFSNNLANGTCGLTDGSIPGDWRLANRKEIESLLDFGQPGPALPSSHPFENVSGDDYWTSTTYTPDPTQAWYIEMGNGVTDATRKYVEKYVWPVRGGN